MCQTVFKTFVWTSKSHRGYQVSFDSRSKQTFASLGRSIAFRSLLKQLGHPAPPPHCGQPFSDLLPELHYSIGKTIAIIELQSADSSESLAY
jgi:hypothetical protein